MNNWSFLEVRQWLMKEFNDPDIAQEFEDQEIDGEVLVSIDNVDKLTTLAPKIKRGKAEKIIIRRDKFIKYPQISEARPFKQPSNGCSYIKDTKLAVNGTILEESGPDIDNILVPIREFKKYTNTSTENAMKKFVFETIRFVTSCMNVRANGTIYFGIEDKTSKIVGRQLHAPMLDFRDALEQNIISCFGYPTKLQAAFRMCCSNPKFIEVVAVDQSDLVVIEIDVEAKYEYVQTLHFEPSIFKSDNDMKREKQLFVRRGSSSKCLMGEEKRIFLNKELFDLTNVRKKAEEPEIQKYATKGKCLEKLLLTESDTFLDISTFPILVLNKIENNPEHETNFDFIRFIKWRVVIDLDCTGKMLDIYKSAGHHITQKSVDSFINNFDILIKLKDEPTTCWIFANGNSVTKDEVYDAVKWNKSRKRGINSAIMQLLDLSCNRGLVVFLFDQDLDGILSDTYELFCDSQFFHEFMKILYIARHEFSIELLKEKMSNWPKKIEEMVHGIIGLPWTHVGAAFRRVSGEQDKDCQLTTSSSTFISVSRNRWSDLHLLGSNECIDVDFSNIDHIKYLQERYGFYSGKQVSWLNIALSDESYIDPVKRHVVKRDPMYEDLKDCVEQSFKRTEKVEIVKVYYRPGSGASTVTRHVLWSFKSKYKCAVITKITNTTKDQIFELYQYGEEDVPEENWKPVLLLLDLPNEEPCEGFFVDIRSKRNVNRLYCVVIQCHKIFSEKQNFDYSRHILLKQSLTRKDQTQFKNILDNSEWIKQLNENHKTNKHHSPDFMLAFLIFHNNFVSDYIEHCVSQYLNSEELSLWEELILKYVSLLNVFNVETPEIPISFFDSLTESTENSRKRSMVDPSMWWNSSSATFKMFCKEIMPAYRLGTVKCVMIVHPLLAQELLKQLSKKHSQTISDITMEFLDSNMFKTKLTHAPNEVVQTTRHMMIKRKQGENKRIQKFSPLIEEILRIENSDKAFIILTKAFEILELKEQKDAFLAQQIARLCFIVTKNFEAALKYGNEAINIQKNSFLWDTMGQIYKAQLEHKFGKYKPSLSTLSISNCKEAIELARKAVDCFRESIKNNQNEATVNIYGFGGEIEVYKMLLELIECMDIFSSDAGREMMYNYLLDEQYIPEQISSAWSGEYHGFMKSLGNNMELSLEKTDSMSTMMNSLKNSNENEEDGDKNSYLRKAVDDGSERCVFFLRNTHKFNAHRLSLWQLNRLRVKELGGLRISEIFKAEKEPLAEMWKLLNSNVNEQEEFNEFDCKTLLVVSMTMVIKRANSNGRINALYMLDLCNTIKHRSTNHQNRHIANFFLSVLLWPGMGRDYNHKIYTQVLTELEADGERLTKKNLTEFSRVAEYTKNGAYNTHFKTKTPFFLGNGKGLQSIIPHSDLPERRHSPSTKLSDSEFWNQPRVRQKLLKLTGVNRGNVISAFIDKTEGEPYRIPVSRAIPSNNVSEELVSFYLGFSWGGPVAYNVIPVKTNETSE